MEKYSEYKDCGVQWIGEVPNHWEVKRLASYFTERKVKVSDKEYAPLSVTKNGVYTQLDNVAKTNDGDNRKLVLSGDFVINSRSDRKGSSGVAKQDGSVSLINIVLRPRKNIYPDFCNYLLKCYSFIEEYYRNGRGIVADLWTTRYDEMKTIKIPVPLLNEQKDIVIYLNKVTSKIDEAIVQQQRMIELLNERKQIIINNAVTKGLNPDVPMKDSGMEWIGEIPEHWEVMKTLFTLSMPITDGPHETPLLYEDGIPFVSAEAVSMGNGGINFNHIRGYISKTFYDECCKKYIPQRYDIYMIKSGATTGKVAIVETDVKFTIWSPLAVFRCNQQIMNPYYLFFVLQSKFYQLQVQLGWSYGTQQNIGMRTLEKLKVTVPPVCEQVMIANKIKEKLVPINNAIKIANKQITLLYERKQLIINNVVMGKVKVL